VADCPRNEEPWVSTETNEHVSHPLCPRLQALIAGLMTFAQNTLKPFLGWGYVMNNSMMNNRERPKSPEMLIFAWLA